MTTFFNFSEWIYLTTLHSLENYGWYMLIAVLLILYLYRKFQSSIDEYWEKKASQDYAAYYHKNPDVLTQRVTAQEQYVDKLQRKYETDAKAYQEKVEEKEHKKKQERLERHSSGGYKLGSSNDKSLKQDYNPLTGDTSSRSYRPQRKTPCSGGGCNK